MSNKINVILVDDHEMVRLGLKSFLNLQGDVEVVGEAENGREGVDLVLKREILALDADAGGHRPALPSSFRVRVLRRARE